MPVKSSEDKTRKYSDLVHKIKGKQPEQEEPRIRPEQVVAAFRSFGYEPNSRNHNDVGYWTTKGQSEGVKLMEELHQRRMEDNKKEDEKKKNEEDSQKANDAIQKKQNESKATLPRLSDTDINNLYDEYGLPPQDPEWVRSHMPNDPQKIRSILETQRKTADDMIKKHSKNAVNAIPETPKGMPPMQPTNNGMGGPSSPSTPLGMQGSMTPGDSPITPHFIGDHALVKITNPNNPSQTTTWLVDANKKVLRPFASDEAFNNTFENPEEAQKRIITISSKELAPGGALAGFKPLQMKHGINHDGSMEPIDFSPAQIQKRYGSQSNPDAENRALTMLDGVLGKIQPKQ